MLSDFGLVIIGAHSGAHLHDLISRYNKKQILLVEPVPYNYEKLEVNFNNLENIHICKNGVLDKHKLDNFYYIKKDSIKKLGKHWASGIGSFDKNHILNHRSKRFKVKDEDIQTKQIEFITFNELAKKFSIKSIDMLQIDVEGAEYQIMSFINYDKIEIKQILFEAKHFDGTFKEGKKLEDIKKLLISKNYKLKKIDNENILATK